MSKTLVNAKHILISTAISLFTLGHGPSRWLHPSYGMLYHVSFVTFQTCILLRAIFKTYLFKFAYG